MKTLFIGLVIAIVASVASSAALTAGNLLVSYKVGGSSDYSRVYVDEITTSGTVVQTFDPNCLLKDDYTGALSFNEDFTSAAFVCYPNSGTPDVASGPKMAVAIQANGTMDTTTITEALYGLDVYSAFIDGRAVWVGTDSQTIVYSKRNGAVIFPDVVTTPGSYTLDIQMAGGAFYIGGFGSTPYFIASVIGGAPKTISNAKTLLTGADIPGGMPADVIPNRFWFYSFSELYGTDDSGGVIKFTQGSQWTYYRSPSVGGALGLVVQNVGNKRMVYITVSQSTDVISFEDDGTQFLNKVVIKSYSLPTTLLDVIYINAPKGSCGDGSKNLDETDVDCGGYSCGLCANTKGCQISDDCASGYCNPNSKCSVPSCSDTFKNQDETDVDCGGATCSSNKCADTKKCFVDSDCVNNYCNPVKKCAVPSCSDGFQNQGETDVDCGGPNCPACADGKACSNPIYCQSQYCNPQGKCSTPSRGDGFTNQNETDVDCGGFSCIGCTPNKSCRSDSDCLTNWCSSSNNKCGTPSCSDGVKNYPESDIDCGGGECQTCDDGKSCKKNSDCSSSDCDSVQALCRAPTTPNSTSPVATTPDDASPTTPGTSPTTSSTPSSASPIAGSTPSGKVVSSSNKLVGASYVIIALVLWMC